MRISDGSSDVFSSDLKSTAAIPAADFAEPVAWAAAGPKTVGAFSAACFYMAQGLRRDLGIPIGAIASDWGGSQARAWLAPGPDRKGGVSGKSGSGRVGLGGRRIIKKKKKLK